MQKEYIIVNFGDPNFTEITIKANDPKDAIKKAKLSDYRITIVENKLNKPSKINVQKND